MILEPLYDKVVVLPDEQSETTESGLLIPISAQEQKNTGVVVAVGKGMIQVNSVVLTPLQVKIGDRVLFNKFSGTEIILDTKKHVIMREVEIQAIIRGESDVKN